VILFEVRAHQIVILNLETYAFTRFPHQFTVDDSALTEVETFYDTKLLCVREHGGVNDHRLVLTYYSYPLKEGDKPIEKYESKEGEWNYDWPIVKANNHSKMVWYKTKHEQEIEFRSFDLKDKLKVVKVQNTLHQGYANLPSVQISIMNIWELKPKIYLLTCSSNKNEAKATNQSGVVNNNFVVDDVAGTIR